jgi:hypothetical protein
MVINTLDGGTLDIADFDEESVMPLLEAWQQDETNILAFALDTGMAYIPKAAVARIDIID